MKNEWDSISKAQDTRGFNWPNMGFLSPIELHFDPNFFSRAAGFFRSSRTARSTCSTRANRDGSSASASMQAAQTCLATAVLAASEFWWSQGSEDRNSVGNEHKYQLVWCEVCYSPQNGNSRGGRFGIHPAVSIAAIVGF